VLVKEKKEWRNRFLPNRLCTFFLYLNDVPEGGQTTWKSSNNYLYKTNLKNMCWKLEKPFPDRLAERPNVTMDLKVTPKKGMAVIHFPSTTPEYNSVADHLADHASEDAISPKYILQQFIWSASRETVEEELKQFGKTFGDGSVSAHELLYGVPLPSSPSE